MTAMIVWTLCFCFVLVLPPFFWQRRVTPRTMGSMAKLFWIVLCKSGSCLTHVTYLQSGLFIENTVVPYTHIHSEEPWYPLATATVRCKPISTSDYEKLWKLHQLNFTKKRVQTKSYFPWPAVVRYCRSKNKIDTSTRFSIGVFLGFF